MINPEKYRHLFFDLDHTLWDFEKNSKATIDNLFDHHKLIDSGVESAEVFYKTYSTINSYYWDLFHKNQIDRETLRHIRFQKTLEEFQITNSLLQVQLANDYLDLLPNQTMLMADTIEVLDYLQSKYHLHIITNGFEMVQKRKMASSKLDQYFQYMITSETANAKKPEVEIFNYAFRLTNASIDDSIFIGDSLEADIQGAINVGMDYIFFNPTNVFSDLDLMCEIKSLIELKQLL